MARSGSASSMGREAKACDVRTDVRRHEVGQEAEDGVGGKEHPQDARTLDVPADAEPDAAEGERREQLARGEREPKLCA